MITKEMLKRCQNKQKQAFCALPEDVKQALTTNKSHVWFLSDSGTWMDCENSPNYSGNGVYRLSPDTPTEPEWEEKQVNVSSPFGIRQVDIECVPFTISNAVCHANFIGIIYLKDGIETLRTSVDAAFGVPVRVRFAKESK